MVLLLTSLKKKREREKAKPKKKKKEKTLRVSVDEYFSPFNRRLKVKCKEKKSAGRLAW